MTTTRKLASQTFIYGGSTIIARALNYLLVFLYTNIFLKEEYGVVSIYYSIASLLNVILTYGMETAFFRYYQKAESTEKNKIYTTSLISIISTSIIFVVFSFVYAQNFLNIIGMPEHPEYVKWFAILLAFDAVSTLPFARLRALNRPIKFAFLKIVNIFSNIVIVIFFLITCPWMLDNNLLPNFINLIYDPTIGIGYIFIANLLASGITFIILMSEIKIKTLQFSYKIWVEMIRYALPLLIFGMAGIVNETMDRLFLKSMLPKDIALGEIGIYSACYKLAIMMTLFIQAFKYAAEPFFFAKSKDKDAKSTYSNIMTYFVIACSFIFLIIMLYIDVIQLFIGKEFREGVFIVPILLMANLFLGIFYNLSIWYKITGQTRFGAYIAIIGAVITIALNYILIPSMGYLGSAWATFACYFVMMILSYFLGQKHYYVNYNYKKIIAYIMLSVALYYLSLFNPIENLTAKVSLNTILALGFIAVIYVIEKKNIKLMMINRNEK